MICIGRTDQGEICLIGNRENDPPVFTLKEIAFVVIKQFARHDMAATHQAHTFRRIDPSGVANDVFDPRPAGVDQHSGDGQLGFFRALIFGGDMPNVIDPLS